MRHVLIVSPHRDDAAFSCAIAIRKLASICRITVANCFTVSEYAPYSKARASSITEERLQEDTLFSQEARVSLNDLNLVDAPQRLSIGMSEISSTRSLNAEDDEPRSAIMAHVLRLNPDLVFCPLAVGDHIDHRIAQASVIDTASPRLVFYEDLPYAARLCDDAPEFRAAELHLNLTPMFFSFPGGREWKKHCASIYASQIEFNTVEEIAGFSERYREGERFWVTPSGVEWLQAIDRE